MKRWISLFAIVALAGLAGGPLTALANPPLKNGTGPNEPRQGLQEPWSVKAFEKEIAEAVQKAASAIGACVRTVVTVAKAVVRGLHSILLTLVKVIVHLAAALVIAVGKWLLLLVLG